MSARYGTDDWSCEDETDDWVDADEADDRVGESRGSCVPDEGHVVTGVVAYVHHEEIGIDLGLGFGMHGRIPLDQLPPRSRGSRARPCPWVTRSRRSSSTLGTGWSRSSLSHCLRRHSPGRSTRPRMAQPPAPLINAPLEGALDTVDRQGSYSRTSLIPKLRTFRNMENV